MKIQIREEEKQISREHVSRSIGISQKQLVKVLNNDPKAEAILKKEKYSKRDLNKILGFLNIEPKAILKKKRKKSWENLLESKICIEADGLFLIDHSIDYDKPLFYDLINEYGIWNAQGLNNHEHIADYAIDPITQLYLAEKVVSKYISRLKKLKHPGKAIIYWNGDVDSTVCIYLQKKNDDKFLKNFDNQLGISKINIYKYIDYIEKFPHL